MREMAKREAQENSVTFAEFGGENPNTKLDETL